MGIERTFSMIKPDATKRNLTGKIIAKLEDGGLARRCFKARALGHRNGRKILRHPCGQAVFW